MARKKARKGRAARPRKKPAGAKRRPRVATHEERVEHFAEEVGRLGGKVARARRPDRLYRSSRDKILGGVCGGIAEYLGMDPTLVRLLWVLFSLVWGTGVLFYIIAWIIIPRNPRHKW